MGRSNTPLKNVMKKNCLFCNKKIIDNTQGLRKKYCSKKCNSAYNYKRKHIPRKIYPKKCLNCKKTFIDKSSHQHGKYCSKKCNARYNRRKNRKYPDVIEKKCEYCKNKFKDETDTKNKKFCSKKCYNVSRFERLYRKTPKIVFKNCKNCNKKFKDETPNKCRLFCNKKCKSKFEVRKKKKFPKTIIKKCETCQKNYKDSTDNKISRYCSRKCRDKIYENLPHVKAWKTKYAQSDKRRKWYREWERKPEVKKLRDKYKKSDKFKLIQKKSQAVRKKRLVEAMPKWANKDKIKNIYAKCKQGYQVDHIIPIKSKYVCGLHVENNLRIIKANTNNFKKNIFIVGKSDKFYSSKSWLNRFNRIN